MRHQEYRVSSGRRWLFAQAWMPDGKARGAVALVHGGGELSGGSAHVGTRVMRDIMPSLGLDAPMELAALSRDPAIAEAAAKDPLYHNESSARPGMYVLSSDAWFADVRGAFPFPLLVMQGTTDRIVDAKAAIDLAGSLSGNIALKTWEEFYHELHNEPEKEQVIAYALSWVNAPQ